MVCGKDCQYIGRPEDIDLVEPEAGTLKGVVTHLIFKGVHYEMDVMACGHEWLVHSTDMCPVGQEVGLNQLIMNHSRGDNIAFTNEICYKVISLALISLASM